MTSNHEQTIKGHVDANVDFAIDQADACGGLEAAFHSYLENVKESVLNDGYGHDGWEEAIHLFCSEFQKKTGKSW
jgi:hypothetical protein